MSFSAHLPQDLVTVDPGSTAPVAVEVANRGETSTTFEISVEGLDPDWVAVPVPIIEVAPGEVASEKVLLKPVRSSESVAGDYPFVVKVRSMATGEVRAMQGVLQVKAYHHLSMEIAPKRGGVSAFNRECAFTVTIVNLGNTEHTLQLYGSDLDDACTFEFAEDRLTVAPGAQRTTKVSVAAKRNPVLGSLRLFALSISARSVEMPSVVCSGQANLERKAVLSPLATLFVVLIAALAIGWFMFLPKPPQVDMLTVDPLQATEGGMVTVSWRTSNATGIRILLNGQVIAERQGATGTATFEARESGTIEAVAVSGDKLSRTVTQAFTVVPPEQAPEPRIVSFDINPQQAKMGDVLTVTYEVNDAVTKLTLAPIDLDLNPRVKEKEIPANRAGTITYTLVAENASGLVDRRQVTIRVAESSLATFVKFDVNPKEVDPTLGQVNVSWQLHNAVRAELSNGRDVMSVDPQAGDQVMIIFEDTTFTMTIFDTEGRTRSQSVKVRMKPNPVVEPPAGSGL
ncbi:MAG: hypothetical protein ACK4XJ_07495 [Fimbriimonadaceae bacterium]